METTTEASNNSHDDDDDVRLDAARATEEEEEDEEEEKYDNSSTSVEKETPRQTNNNNVDKNALQIRKRRLSLLGTSSSSSQEHERPIQPVVEGLVKTAAALDAAAAAKIVAAEFEDDDAENEQEEMDAIDNTIQNNDGAGDQFGIATPRPATSRQSKHQPKSGAGDDDNKHNSSNNNSNGKAHSFRKRRLSLTLSHVTSLSDEEDNDDNEGDDEDESTTRIIKRQKQSQLSYNHNNNNNSDKNSFAEKSLAVLPEAKPRRLSTSSSAASSTSWHNNDNKPRTLHSAEMISGLFAPPSPIYQNPVLHQQNPLPPFPSSVLDLVDTPTPTNSADVETEELSVGGLESHSLEFSPRRHRTRRKNSNSGRRNSWRKRHYLTDDDMLPFPKHLVGTYSCHGIEPIYDERDYYTPPQQSPTTQGGGPLPLPALTPPMDSSNNLPPPPPVMISAKINQDRGGITYPYANCRRTALFAVFDGHGQGGELVSQFALHEIQCRLENHPSFHTNLEQALRETFLTVDEALRKEPIIEPFFAGTTACVALLQDQLLTLANAGDSRAVLGRRQRLVTNRPDDNQEDDDDDDRDEGTWESVDLTQDQNPDTPLEMERILKRGGYVSPPPGPGLSARVWLDSEMTQIGLAMARSIGDHAVSEVGVIADPVVSTHYIQEGDEFLIVASDGVWEFVQSLEAVQIVGEHLPKLGATKACQALIEAAASKWHEEEGEYRDDITAIVVHLPPFLWAAADQVETPTATTFTAPPTAAVAATTTTSTAATTAQPPWNQT